MANKAAIEKAVRDLIAACGYNQSESASEWFTYLLDGATTLTLQEIDRSHDKEGLCIDASLVLTNRLYRNAPRAVKAYEKANRSVVRG